MLLANRFAFFYWFGEMKPCCLMGLSNGPFEFERSQNSKNVSTQNFDFKKTYLICIGLFSLVKLKFLLAFKPAFLNPKQSATRFIPQPAIFGSRMKSKPIWQSF